MSISKLQLGISGALAVAGATGLVLQAQSNAELREEVAVLRRESAAMATARAENTALKRAAADVVEMRGDDAALLRLRDDAAALTTRMQAVARTQAARAADSAEIFEPRTLDQQPQPRFQSRPRYPGAARKAGLAGEAVVEFVVDAQGDVHGARVVPAQREKGAAAGNFVVATNSGGEAVAGGDAAALQREFDEAAGIERL